MRDRVGQRFRRHLAADARHADELEAAAEKFRRAAFVGEDMRLGMRKHRAPRRADMRERQRIGRRAGRHQEHGDLVLENLADPPFDRAGDVIVAIAHGEAVIAGDERLQDFRRDAGGVVACEIHGIFPIMGAIGSGKRETARRAKTPVAQ